MASGKHADRWTPEHTRAAALTAERQSPARMLVPGGLANTHPSRMTSERPDANISTHTKARKSRELVAREGGVFGDFLWSRREDSMCDFA
jgi:hypothetical protein